ncbi:hypothetical protein L7F22_047547 [Adiantum nelumboides]|nr:hypothetical protein [Adiantum nelumboides]MCO5593533.1 hypothetical protein [Adiantum nelumboides]
MVSKSKVLVIGATGYIGRHIALAGPAEGHPTFALVRPSTLASKAPLLHSFQAAGISLLQFSDFAYRLLSLSSQIFWWKLVASLSVVTLFLFFLSSMVADDTSLRVLAQL